MLEAVCLGQRFHAVCNPSFNGYTLLPIGLFAVKVGQSLGLLVYQQCPGSRTHPGKLSALSCDFKIVTGR